MSSICNPGMRSARSVVQGYLESLDARAGGVKHYVPSGFRDADKKFGAWLHDGHLIIVAGRPAMGKSAFAQQVAEQVAAQDKTAIFISLEMTGHELIERSLSRRSGIPVPKLKIGDLNEREWDQIGDAMSQVNTLPLLIDDASFDIDALISKIKTQSESLAANGLPPLGLVVIDYLQLVVGKGSNRTLELSQVSGGLKRLAKELRVPVVALSQLNRSVEGRNDKRPTLADLRESGAIEQDADLVLFVYRDEYYDAESPDKGTAELIVGKNRHGTTGTVRLAFVGERVMFGDLAK